MSNAAPVDIEISSQDEVQQVRLRGPFTIANVTDLHARLSSLSADRAVHLDLSEVTRFDTAASWALIGLQLRVEEAGQTVEVSDARAAINSLLSSVKDAMPDPDTAPPQKLSLADRLENVGRAVTSGANFVLALVGYFGLFLSRLLRAFRHPSEFRLTSLVHHCHEVGVKAVPIVALMSFLIGVVLAFQGATQLQQFGAEVFVVDLIAISILRELGILLTSIIVAGRTASAFTASIGSMKMREEIDAMRALGLDTAMVLFVPRILALLFMLPILGMISNVMGLFGGALMAWIDLGISPAMFITRLIEGTSVDQVTIGMVKAPVFAVIIGVVGCHAGMQVKSNAESLGRMTSSAVVTAIFAVIVADALFSIFFAQLGDLIMAEAQSDDRQETADDVVIRLRGIRNQFGRNVVHDELDLDVYRGEILGVVGGSGTGKSVLLRTIAGLQIPKAGSIEVLGTDVRSASEDERAALEARWGVMFQDGALFSSLNVRENVEVPMRPINGLDKQIRRNLADLKISMVGLPFIAGDNFPSELSGGMRKRAGLARALALDPDIVFLDEPTAGLDPIGAAEFDRLIHGLSRSLGLTVFLVTHDLDTLHACCDRIAVLAEKKVLVTGTMKEMMTVDHPWVHEYFHGPRARAATDSAQAAGGTG